MTDSLIFVLKKMCTYVDVDFDDIDYQEDDWYLKYEWTREEEIDFIDWLANELKSNNNIRKELSNLPYRPSKARRRLFAEHFNMMFGWKTKQKEL